MPDRLSAIEARIRQLEAVIADLQPRLISVEQHVDRIETHALAGVPAADQPIESDPARGFTTIPGRLPDVSSVVALIGRTLLVLAGAFLLRALTDSGRLDAGLGVLLGVVFAATWIGMADRTGSRQQGASAVFHGLAFVLITFPLIFEATTRFRFLSPEAAAAGLAACMAVALIVGWRQHLHGVTWIASAGGAATALGLVFATAEIGPFAFLLIGLGVALLWFGYVFEWRLLRWPAALLADVAILGLSVRAVAPGSADTPAVAYTAQALLLVGYLGSFGTRTLLLNRDVIPFEVAQSIAATVVGLGGAAVLTHVTQTRSGELPLGVATLALAAACYGAAAVFVRRQQSRRRNYYFYTSAAFVFALAGTALSLPSWAIGPVYAVFSVLAAWLGRVADRVTYRAHAATYFMAATIATGAFPYVAYGLGLPLVPNGSVSMAVISLLVLGGVAMWGLRPGSSSALRRVPRVIVLTLWLGGVLGTTVSWGLVRSGASFASPEIVATVRTGLLVISILALGLADRVWDFSEGAWLVYPLLGVTGLKFLVEDIRVGRPATLVAGFALYGLALIVAPRLRRRDIPTDQRRASPH